MVEIAIDRESQGRGYGSYLMSQSLANLKRNGISRVGLTVDPNNLRNLHIYRDKFKFGLVDYLKNEYGEGRDRLYLELDLDGRKKV